MSKVKDYAVEDAEIQLMFDEIWADKEMKLNAELDFYKDENKQLKERIEVLENYIESIMWRCI